MKHLALAATTLVALLFPSIAMAGGWETTVEKVPVWAIPGRDCTAWSASPRVPGTAPTSSRMSCVPPGVGFSRRVISLTCTVSVAADLVQGDRKRFGRWRSGAFYL